MESATSSIRKPRLLVAASPLAGHVNPLIRIAAQLADRGYEITFIAAKEQHENIEKFGGKPVLMDAVEASFWVQREQYPAGIQRMLFDMRNYFIEQTEARMRNVYTTLEAMQEADPSWPILIMTETFFTGAQPMYNGAPLPKGFTTRPRIININPLPYALSSRDTYPFGPGLAPDVTENGRVKMKAMAEELSNGPWKENLDAEKAVMEKLGAINYKQPAMVFDTWTLSNDVTLQMCPESVEYPRSDVPEKVQYAGAVLPQQSEKKNDFPFPGIWTEVASGEKKLVLVTQGTVSLDYTHLVIPTLEALSSRSDAVVLAILGKRGASLPADFQVPSNAHVVDYLPYEDILPHASVFVFNAGYGGFLHGIASGVPMVLGGATEDKPEVAMRAECSGVGLNLRTGEPTVKQVTDAVNKVLDDSKYKERVMEIKKENEALKAMDVVEKTILDLAALD